MANEILLTPEELRGQARQIKALKNADKNTMWNLTRLVQTLTVAWNSPSQEAFVNKYMSMQPTVDSFHQAIEDFAVLMEKHADRMEKVDRDMADRISRL